MSLRSSILIVFSLCWMTSSYSKPLIISDFCSEQKLSIEIKFNLNPNHRLLIQLIQDKQVLDSITYSGLAWKGTEKLLDSKHLRISLPLKAGRSHHLEKTIILYACEGRLIEKMNIYTDEISEYSDQFEEKEIYKVNLKFGMTDLTLKVEEFYSLQSGDLENKEWTNSCTLLTSNSKNIYYSDQVELKEARDIKTNELISGSFFALFLRRYAYVFINEQWYVFTENYELYR